MPLRRSLLPLLLLLISAASAAAVSGNVTAAYSKCSSTFDCGPLRNLSYPFTGGDRPAVCGPPEFRLTCHGDSAELTTASMPYRVLTLDQTSRSLTLARSDLYNNTCLSKDYANTTLNATVFTSDPTNVELTLFYDCNTLMNLRPQNLFFCEINGTDTFSYYMMGPVPSDPILNISKCNMSITDWILPSAETKLATNRSLLKEGLMEGFAVNYSNPYDDHCAKCRRLQSECGFDSVLGTPQCICGDQICPDSGGSDKTLPIVLPVVGAILTGLLLGFWIFSLRQKRRRKKEAAEAAAAAAAASSAQTQSKDISPFSSKGGLPISMTTYSRTTASYASTRTDIEKSTYFGVQVFSYVELEEATHHFDPARELGEGGFGTVYYGELPDGRVVAVKRLYENNMKRVEQFMNEVEILTRLRHKNLVTLFGCTSRRSRELLLVYEYIPNGTVADHIHGKLRSGSSLVTWTIRLNIAIETADALAYLHESDVIHRDVKTNNILLDNDFCVKVADFGLSRLFPNDVSHVSTAPQGTPGYVDPEYYQCYQLTDKSDVYSFGVVLCELISSKAAVDTNRHRHDINLANMAINKIQNHTLHELVDPSLGFETDYKVKRMMTLVAELAFRCLQQEKDMRPTMLEVVEALRRIKNEERSFENVEIVDIRSDDAGFMKNNIIPPPLSPDSFVTDKGVSNSDTPSSF